MRQLYFLSGAGKTTLMTALAQRSPGQYLKEFSILTLSVHHHGTAYGTFKVFHSQIFRVY